MCITFPSFQESLQECLEYCDIVVGNSDEARALVDNFGLPDCGSLHEIVRRISELPKRNKKRNRIVIITQQADPVVVFRGKSKRLLSKAIFRVC